MIVISTHNKQQANGYKNVYFKVHIVLYAEHLLSSKNKTTKLIRIQLKRLKLKIFPISKQTKNLANNNKPIIESLFTQ